MVFPSASEPALEIVGANVEQNIGITLYAKKEPVALSNPALPQAPVALHLLGLKGGVTRILQKESELLFRSLLNRWGQRLKIPAELLFLSDLHTGRELRKASGLSNSS